MKDNHPTRLPLHPISALLGSTLLLTLPSAQLLTKYLGFAGSVVFLVIVMVSLAIVYRCVLVRFSPTDTQVLWLTTATFLVLLTLFLVLYPLANTNVPGKGSDRDEALNAATSELLQGRYPYYPKIYSGNPITPLPGSLLLAIPFVLLGNSAYQNFFWLFAFLLTMNVYLKDKRLALLSLWVLLAFSPVVLHEIVTGGDLLANSIYVPLFVIWMVRAASRHSTSRLGRISLATLLGIGMASRANFLLILPLVFSALVRAGGWQSAVRQMMITGLTFGLLTVPFYLHDPSGFSPLHTANQLSQFEAKLPYASAIIPAFASIVALGLSFHHTNGSAQGLARNCAVVLALPVLGVTILKSIMAGYPWLAWTSLGLSFLFFGAVALSPMSTQE